MATKVKNYYHITITFVTIKIAKLNYFNFNSLYKIKFFMKFLNMMDFIDIN